jgi:hypothetical protein
MHSGIPALVIRNQKQEALPDEEELAELTRLRDRFRSSHHIYRHLMPGRGVRYIAHGASLGTRPHTVITDDLSELGNELGKSVPKPLSLCTRPTPPKRLAYISLGTWTGNMSVRKLFQCIAASHGGSPAAISP